MCGNGVLEPGEQCEENTDCVKYGKNRCSKCSCAEYCGDNQCSGNENQENCCMDCGCPHKEKCEANACQPIACGDQVCSEGETFENC